MKLQAELHDIAEYALDGSGSDEKVQGKQEMQVEEEF